ncbi:hypothetical protein P175DRAFT_0467401 [Aspergillus ochraceoroseus IBT 24754]|uniref:Uncharacterized protein n=2 Tax=Aspergillus ochraceoroseus TaxID=138278 RepID=A0A2T5LL80_9EURO|nr:uncharacterized protein P175DRAFT_0467401 [Aspergillus ochraceoroseus IBT 24754]PTU17038.1 hypothetical protein P175DRAFT_0467401 [Aspergillus ochraceoroseus IBT 24754]
MPFPVQSFQDVIGLSSFMIHAIRHPLDFQSSVGPTLSEITSGLLGSSFEPGRDIPDLSGKVIFVTGGNTGLGRETVLQLAQHNPSRIYLGARNATKAQNAISSIQDTLPSPEDIRHIPLDLASFKSIRAAVEKFQSECDRLDILVLNAGIMGCPSSLTEDGFEIHFGTNHVGHFLLTKLLLSTLQQTVSSSEDVRVVTLSSLANQSSPSYDIMTSTQALMGTGWVTCYGASKAANVLFAAELARRYPKILSVSVHPGAVASDLYEQSKSSDLFSRVGIKVMANFFRSVRTGALNQIWAATVSKERLINGGYYVPIGVKGIMSYRKYLPDLGIPRFQEMRTQDAHEYADAFKNGHNPPWLHALYMHWRELLQEPFKGVTTDGNVRPNLFELQDEQISIDSIVAPAEHLLSLLTSEQKDTLCYHIDSPEWRTWSNPEFLLSDKGLRLDEVSPSIRTAILAILQSTLSPEGYDKALKAMRTNHFLGELVESPRVMNEFSYNFALFGRPSITRPWGWSFYGHHLCLNIFLYRNQIIASPWFTGAEPNEIDAGPYKGTRILHVEEELGLKLMQSLPAESQATAQIYKEMHDPAMPPGRWNRDDQRHVCGAYRDNRIVPYEGVPVSSFTEEQKRTVYAILEQYLLYLPGRARQLKLEQIKRFESETHFCWIGGYAEEDPFYFRIQNPVVLVEFDHHSGVFLNNEAPKKFHIHTLLRTPNAGDYGYAIRPMIPAVEGLAGKEITW